MQHGRNIMVFLNGTAIAATRSNEIQIDCDVIEISNPSIGDWKQYITGRKDWSVNVSFLVAAAADIRNVLNTGTTYTLQFRDRNGSSVMSGSAILQTAKISAQIGNLCTGSFVFKGSGQLS